MLPEIHISQAEKPSANQTYLTPNLSKEFPLDWRNQLRQAVPNGVFSDQQVNACPELGSQIATCNLVWTNEDKGKGKFQVDLADGVYLNLSTLGKALDMTDEEIAFFAGGRASRNKTGGPFVTRSGQKVNFYVVDGKVNICVSNSNGGKYMEIPLRDMPDLLASSIVVDTSEYMALPGATAQAAQTVDKTDNSTLGGTGNTLPSSQEDKGNPVPYVAIIGSGIFVLGAASIIRKKASSRKQESSGLAPDTVEEKRSGGAPSPRSESNSLMTQQSEHVPGPVSHAQYARRNQEIADKYRENLEAAQKLRQQADGLENDGDIVGAEQIRREADFSARQTRFWARFMKREQFEQGANNRDIKRPSRL